MRLCLRTLLAVILLTPVFLVQAQTCGNIITPANYYYEGSEEQSDPIQNCDNPLGRTGDLTTFRLNSESIQNNVTYTVTEEGTGDYGIGEESFFQSSGAIYYKHSGQDLIRVNTNYFEPVQSDVETTLRSYFNNDESQVQKYTKIYLADYRQPYFYDDIFNQYYYDSVADDFVWRVYAFAENYVEQNVVTKRPSLLPGTYTVVQIDTDEGVFPTFEPSFLKRLFATIIPTTYAYYYVNTVTFTLASPTPQPTGASSVLFLPGIMGSRLYEDADGCNTTGEGQERWVSLAVCDQLRLKMSLTGNSINDIYTKSGESSILVSQVYKTFFDNLKYWKNDEKIIKDYVAVPYDWRLGLDNLLKVKLDDATGKLKIGLNSSVQDGYLYKTIAKLAEESFTGKVTIVAHSNGGLLAKAFLATLDRDNDPLAGKVDVLILVASPQLGTPDTLVGMLHGSEIAPYLLNTRVAVSQVTSRQLLGTMPFAYHLLPSEQYFNGSGVTVNTPVLTFEPGSLTTPWANTYGNTVTSAQKMQAFMQTSSGRSVPAVDNLDSPAVVSGTQFDYSNSIHLLMNAWVPPASMKVYEIAGTGIDTASGIKYYTGRECGVLNPVCFIFKPKLLYKVEHTIDGDGTVVVSSALAISTSSPNVARRWLNLDSFNRSGLLGTRDGKNHSNIFDVSEISVFIINTLKSATSSNYQYISDTPPNITSEDRLEFYLHSPLDMSIKLANGNEISSSSPLTNDGTYRRYGELQYISIPDTNSNKTLILKGTASGSFTLEIEQFKNGSTTKRQSYSAIPSSTSTQVTIPLTNGAALSSVVLAVDYDGNGTVDVNYDTSGQVVTYNTLFSALNSLATLPIYKKLLMETAKIAEQNYQKSLTKSQFKKLEKVTLNVLKQQIILYGKLKIISSTEQQKVLVIIDNLLNK